MTKDEKFVQAQDLLRELHDIQNHLYDLPNHYKVILKDDVLNIIFNTAKKVDEAILRFSFDIAYDPEFEYDD